MTTETTTFAYAVQINPATGQQQNEISGLELPAHREWGESDDEQYPQARRQLWSGGRLIVDTEDGSVYAV